MSAAVPALPEDQLRTLQAAYRQAISAKRRQALLFVVIFICCMLLAARVGEVDLAKFADGLPRFYSYFYDIVPKLSVATLRADLAEWYWNLDGWLLLLLDTLLIAYVGTFMGA